MVTKLRKQGATRTLNVPAIVSFFGGTEKLVRDLERHQIVGLTPYAVMQWLVRDHIPHVRRADLIALARLQRRKDFELDSFLQKPVERIKKRRKSKPKKAIACKRKAA
jgi:hypothetical protein